MMEVQVAFFPGREGFAFFGDLAMSSEGVTGTIQ
jgi:hypothetical protein